VSRSIAIIGASRDRTKYGNKAVRAYLRIGYRVYPIHPQERDIEGQPAYPSLGAVPGTVDRVALYVPPQVGIKVLDAIAARRPVELYLNPGTESDELLERARALGLEPIRACAVRAIGVDPGTLDETGSTGATS
jgi:predicted CoA-binding protein